MSENLSNNIEQPINNIVQFEKTPRRIIRDINIALDNFFAEYEDVLVQDDDNLKPLVIDTSKGSGYEGDDELNEDLISKTSNEFEAAKKLIEQLYEDNSIVHSNVSDLKLYGKLVNARTNFAPSILESQSNIKPFNRKH